MNKPHKVRSCKKPYQVIHRKEKKKRKSNLLCLLFFSLSILRQIEFQSSHWERSLIQNLMMMILVRWEESLDATERELFLQEEPTVKAESLQKNKSSFRTCWRRMVRLKLIAFLRNDENYMELLLKDSQSLWKEWMIDEHSRIKESRKKFLGNISEREEKHSWLLEIPY